MPAEPKIPTPRLQFFPIRLNSVPTGIPLAFDIYLFVASKPVLFRKKGDVLTSERMKSLHLKGGEQFLVHEDQRVDYMQSIRNIIKNPDSDTETKAKFIKESAFIHVSDLFTKENISEVVHESQFLVEEMVNFVSSDVAAVTSLMRLSVHDYYTYNHCVDVAVYSIVLAKKVLGDDRETLIKAGLGGLLHDIGKRKIDKAIINKSTPLTPEEWQEIRKHPTYGKDFLQEIDSIPQNIRAVVHEHHENFDGTGYPQALKGDDISKLARVVTIADVFDALTTNRSYHKAITPVQALNTMYAMQPGKFDPTIFKSFNKNFASVKAPIVLPADFDPCKPPSDK